MSGELQQEEDGFTAGAAAVVASLQGKTPVFRICSDTAGAAAGGAHFYCWKPYCREELVRTVAEGDRDT